MTKNVALSDNFLAPSDSWCFAHTATNVLKGTQPKMNCANLKLEVTKDNNSSFAILKERPNDKSKVGTLNKSIYFYRSSYTGLLYTRIHCSYTGRQR